MTRTTINIPNDLYGEINRMRNKEPKLSYQEGLIRLARQGVFNQRVDELVMLGSALEGQFMEPQSSQELATLIANMEASKSYSVQIIMLLRELLVKQFGKQGETIINRVKENIANQRK